MALGSAAVTFLRNWARAGLKKNKTTKSVFETLGFKAGVSVRSPCDKFDKTSGDWKNQFRLGSNESGCQTDDWEENEILGGVTNGRGKDFESQK